MSKHTSLHTIPALLMLALACSKGEEAPPGPPPPPPPLEAVLPNRPVPPQAIALAQESGTDVTQLTFTTPLKPDSIVHWYEWRLAEPPFRLVSQQKVKEQTIFLAEQDGRTPGEAGPPLWVTIESNGDGGTAVRLAGGTDLTKKPDSSAVKKP